MNHRTTQPERVEHGPKQLRADGQVLARSQFALVSGEYSSSFLIAGCTRKDRILWVGGVNQAVCVAL